MRLNDYNWYVPGQWSLQGRRIWFVVNREDLQTWDRERRARFEELLRDECRLEARFDVGWTPRDLDVAVYSR